VVPGPWTDGERAFQAQSVAGMVANNASFNCNSAKLLVTARGWEGRGPFVDAVADALGKAPPRSAWYPGAEQRWGAFVEGREKVLRVGSAKAGELPWAVLRDVDPKRLDDRVFRQEPWCAVLSETAVEAEDPVAYLEAAVDFVNGSVWGTLAAMVVVSDATLKLPGVAAAFEKALQRLRYGGVAVNTWAGTLFALGTTPWGGHPSTTPEDIQSGRGFVHNTLMFESIEKVVIRAPAANFPALPWFPGHKTAHVLGERLTAFEAEPSWLKVPGLAVAGLRA
jgi:aldehyde dehydrogenase (NAD(P)+)